MRRTVHRETPRAGVKVFFIINQALIYHCPHQPTALRPKLIDILLAEAEHLQEKFKIQYKEIRQTVGNVLFLANHFSLVPPCWASPSPSSTSFVLSTLPNWRYPPTLSSCSFVFIFYLH